MLSISVVSYLLSTLFLYFGVGNIVSMSIKTSLLAAQQTVKAIKQGQSIPIEVSIGSPIVFVVIGLLLLGIATAFLAACLVVAFV